MSEHSYKTVFNHLTLRAEGTQERHNRASNTAPDVTRLPPLLTGVLLQALHHQIYIQTFLRLNDFFNFAHGSLS